MGRGDASSSSRLFFLQVQRLLLYILHTYRCQPVAHRTLPSNSNPQLASTYTVLELSSHLAKDTLDQLKSQLTAWGLF